MAPLRGRRVSGRGTAASAGGHRGRPAGDAAAGAAGEADVLFGDHPPTGRLPVSWPRSAAQLPVNVGDPGYDPLFAYGFGLTYR